MNPDDREWFEGRFDRLEARITSNSEEALKREAALRERVAKVEVRSGRLTMLLSLLGGAAGVFVGKNS